MTTNTELIFEIGTEEIPARMATESASMLKTLFTGAMAARGLEGFACHVYVTPRRLLLHCPVLPLSLSDKEEEKKGPPAAAAFDSSGQPTRAAAGFAATLGLTVDQLERRATPKGEYLYAKVTTRGAVLAEFLPELLLGVMKGLRFARAMHWGSETELFVRPIHWIVAVFDGKPLKFRFADVESGNVSQGHRFLGKGPIEVADFAGFAARLAQDGVVISPEERKRTIREGIAKFEAASGRKVIEDEELLDTVTHLCEYPVVLDASFHPRYLVLPKEVLVTSMRTHLKVFAVGDGAGGLAPHFVVVANNRVTDPEVVKRGNERVLRARLHDAMFFLEEDKKRSLETFVPSLDGRLFMQGLGTVGDKAKRLVKLASGLSRLLYPAQEGAAARAALLAKADLATLMVGEFPDLQGVMGREYAKAGGEDAQVATAIFEHYLPRFAGDRLPQTEAGALVSIADKADSLVGIFGLGQIPTSTKDPYALRRAALGLVRILLDRELRVGLRTIIDLAAESFGPGFGVEGYKEKLLDFILTRLKIYLSEGMASEIVDSVTLEADPVCADFAARAKAISAIRTRPDYAELLTAFKRVINISRKVEVSVAFDGELLFEDAEKGLWQQYQDAGPALERALKDAAYETALGHLLALKPAVDTYFDKVFVNCEDEALRNNRLAMMKEIGAAFLSLADFTKIPA